MNRKGGKKMADEKKNRFGPDPFFCPSSSRDWGEHEDDEYDGVDTHGGQTVYKNCNKNDT